MKLENIPTKDILEEALTLLYYLEDDRLDYKNKDLSKAIDLLQAVKFSKKTYRTKGGK